ncbi:MAG TPA: hypothetical protein VHO70_08405, partial [Chitinispirillaceae bacterium]|nr:hypothetical protein [Chitinispirillaceae bacterium]
GAVESLLTECCIFVMFVKRCNYIRISAGIIFNQIQMRQLIIYAYRNVWDGEEDGKNNAIENGGYKVEDGWYLKSWKS